MLFVFSLFACAGPEDQRFKPSLTPHFEDSETDTREEARSSYTYVYVYVCIYIYIYIYTHRYMCWCIISIISYMIT